MDGIYDNLGGFMTGMKMTVLFMKHSIGDSCNGGKYPLSIGSY